MDCRKTSWYSTTYALALVFLGTITGHGSALSISLMEMECVSENVLHDGDTVSGNFVVMDHDIFWSSDHPGIEFTATSPNGHLLYALKGTSGDKFEFKARESGIYNFCFKNPSSTPETVSFYIHVGHIPNESDLAKHEHLDPVQVKIAELREALESIIAEQRYLKAREARHRHTNESTRRRVVFYTITEYVLFASTSTLQVIYIRRLFSKSYAYHRV
ncbi:transmembrane emp24 domain-containing protein p24beta3-like [Prosopis cineraria]|uniref:transmembrane emp24 domain-containing protein p24beta3-like n=1 Tax=Prosopis cineraria TaxID=364024 RepID=UPI00240F0D48|nr:transmembrane emp24 domain-containing protein p24beta3-like [Prosopis cineraria]